MSPQRYQQVATNDEDASPITPTQHQQSPVIPNSPPPSFRSRASSPTSQRLLHTQDPLTSDADQALADSFDAPSDDDEDSQSVQGQDDGRQRLIRTRRGNNSRQASEGDRPQGIERRVTQLPIFNQEIAAPTGRVYGGGSQANDGVFANLNAKPERGEKLEELPPTYEQAAADATPPYWETTILAPGMSTDDVYIQGLPVGSVFSFAWNGLISMSFQLVGFLLTYLLHTTHAAKNGSLAGLGITLVQFGFSMRSGRTGEPDAGTGYTGQPPDPNSHDFDPSAAAAAAALVDAANGNASGTSTRISSFESSNLIAYGLMIVGWLVLIRATTNFLKARRHEQLVLQSPDRGLGVPVVATGEDSETVV